MSNFNEDNQDEEDIKETPPISKSSLSDNCVFVAKQFFKFNNIKTNSNENNDVYCSR
ncbi:15204_t:CDS:2 [Entrophospora sp. SA101]|nr:15204_t:CDS:2 [Entrophospora sp. SA101]